MNSDKFENILFNAAAGKHTGYINVDGARIPVQINDVKLSTDEPAEVSCEVRIPTRNAKTVAEQFAAYAKTDCELTVAMYKNLLNSTYGKNAYRESGIKDVIFNPPATIVFWKDGTKTVVKAEGEDYDPEKGLAMAIAKKTLGNKHDYYNVFKKWLKKASKQTKELHSNTRTIIGKVCSLEESPDGLYARVGLNSTVEASKLIKAVENGQIASFELTMDAK